MQLEDYTTGTASVSNGSSSVTGTGTAWSTADFKAGDTFHAQGLVGIIASVDNDTAITLRDVWAGTTITAGAYLLRYQPDNSRMQGTTRQVLDQLRQGIWLTPDATGKTADKATYDDRAAGFRFLDVSVDPFKLYVKETDTSGDWSAGADWVGPRGDAGSSEVVGTSATSLAIATGSKTFAIAEVNRGWGVGARLRASSDADGANFMEGIVTSYASDSLALSVDLVGGSGTFADWTINLAGSPGDISSAATDASSFGFVAGKDATPANTSKVLPTVERVDAETVYKAASRTAMEALSGAAHSSVSFDGHIWKFDSSNLSTEVTSDTLQGTYVAPSSDTTGASGAWVRQRGSANHSVIEYGADRTGTASSVNAFSAAVGNAPAAVTSQYSYAAMPLPETVIIDVPDGTYKMDDYVDLNGRDVVWNLADSAVIVNGVGDRNAMYMQGRIVRRNRMSLSAPSGILDTACGHSVHVGYGSYDQSAQIIGFTDPAKVGMNDTLDLAGVEIDVLSPPLIHQSAATAYTATGATLSTPVNVKQLVKGMFVETTNTPPERGQLTDWAADGSSITVTGWYPVTPGTQTAGVTPSTAHSVLFNPVSKIWGMNWLVGLHVDGVARQASGLELDLANDIAAPTDAESKNGQTWGIDVANAGTYTGSSAFIARGSFFEGFRAAGAVSAFVAKADAFSDASAIGLNFTGDGAALVAQNAAGHRTVQIGNNVITLGDQEASNVTQIKARTSGDSTRDYDSRLVFTGGTAGSDGTGEIDIYAVVTRTMALQPLLDNTYAFGSASLRWAVVFSATGTINTSDARLKTVRGGFSDAEMRAVDRVMNKGPVVYQWNDAITTKGDDARLHAGFIAQDWMNAFEAEGLDWHRYAAFCEDDVYEAVEVTEERREPVMEDYETEETVPVEDADGRYVQRTRKVVKSRPKTEQRQLYAEDGSIVTKRRKAKDAEGRTIGYETVPVYVTHTFMTTKVEKRMEKRATGEKRYGLRYDQCWAMIFAWIAWKDRASQVDA